MPLHSARLNSVNLKMQLFTLNEGEKSTLTAGYVEL